MRLSMSVGCGLSKVVNMRLSVSAAGEWSEWSGEYEYECERSARSGVSGVVSI